MRPRLLLILAVLILAHGVASAGAPRKVTLSFRVVPEDAQVYEKLDFLGLANQPVRLDVSRLGEGQAEFTFKREGYEDGSLQVPAIFFNSGDEFLLPRVGAITLKPNTAAGFLHRYRGLILWVVLPALALGLVG
ncbi:MAG: hypothetical protein AB1758_38195, partial [Candidatus Eremiobacterota bacterium]